MKQNCKRYSRPGFLIIYAFVLIASINGNSSATAADPQFFMVGEHEAFVMDPPEAAKADGAPWVDAMRELELDMSELDGLL